MHSFNEIKFGYTINILESEILFQKDFLERGSDNERHIIIANNKILELEKAIECLKNCV